MIYRAVSTLFSTYFAFVHDMVNNVEYSKEYFQLQCLNRKLFKKKLLWLRIMIINVHNMNVSRLHRPTWSYRLVIVGYWWLLQHIVIIQLSNGMLFHKYPVLCVIFLVAQSKLFVQVSRGCWGEDGS